MATRIGLLGNSTMQNDGQILPVIFCSAELPRRPILRAIGGQITFLTKSLCWWWWWSLHGFLSSRLNDDVYTRCQIGIARITKPMRGSLKWPQQTLFVCSPCTRLAHCCTMLCTAAYTFPKRHSSPWASSIAPSPM